MNLIETEDLNTLMTRKQKNKIRKVGKSDSIKYKLFPSLRALKIS